MKRLSLSLKNKQMTLSQLLVVIVVLIVTGSTLGYSDNYAVPQYLGTIFEKYDPYVSGANFLFGEDYLLSSIFDYTFSQPVFLLLASFFCSFTAFKFLHRKSLALTTLSFPVSRKTMFRKKLIIPLVIISLAVIISKSVALYFNGQYWGFTSNLFGAFIANTLITLQYVFLGFVAGAFGRMFAGRMTEGVLTSVSVALLPKAIYFLISGVNSLFLHGFTSIIYGLNEAVLFLDPLKHIFSMSNTYNSVYIKTPVPYQAIYASLFWIVVFIACIFVLRNYFIKNTRFETVGIMGRRKVINLLNALTIPTFIAGFYIEEWISLNLVTGEKWLLLILLIVLVVVVALIINSIFTRKIRFNKQKISIAVVGVSSFLIVTVIAITGGLGYEKRIPDSDDIDTMYIDFSFDIIEAASGDYDLIGGGYDFIKCGISSGTESISFSDKKDLEKALKLHKILSENKSKETAEMITITYLLKNGTIMERNYCYVPFEACDYSLSLWETDTIKNKYEDILLHSNENIYHEDEYLSDLNYDEKKIALSDGAIVQLVSKDDTFIPLVELTQEDFIAIKTAIYNDIKSLTWEEWFKPDKTYGFISFKNSHKIKRNLNGILEDFGSETFFMTFSVTSEMTKTVELLKELNYFDEFESTKVITKAFVLDCEDSSAAYAAEFTFTDEVLNFYHSVLFNSSRQYSRINATTLSNKIEGSRVLIPIAKEVSEDEAEELFNKSHQRYYCRDDSDLLLVRFSDLSTAEYIIPKG